MIPHVCRVVHAELRHALRACVAHRLVAVTVILVTAVAIGGVTALGGLVKRVLIDPLPFAEPARLMRVTSTQARTGRTLSTPYATYDEWRRQNGTFEELAAFSAGRPTLQLRDGAEPFDVAYVGDAMHRVLGLTPMLGRSFEAHEFQPGQDGVLLLTHEAWRRMFQEDPAVLGRQLAIDDRSYSIVGVLPPTTFEYPRSAFGMDAWLPLARSATTNATAPVMVVGRLKPGVTADQAQADLAIVAARLASDSPDANRDRGVEVVSLQEATAAAPRPAILLVLGALAVVFAIACVNVANLLLARAEARRRDFAIMAALGVSRAALGRQLLFENALLATSGAALGLLVAPWMLGAFLALYPDPLPRPVGGDVILEVAPLAVAIAWLTAVLTSLPVLATIRHGSIVDLVGDNRTRSASPASLRLRAGLVVVQLALSLVLLGAATHLTRTFVALSTTEPGYDDSIMAFAMGMVQRDRSPERATQFYAELAEILGRQPGITGVAMANNLPTRGGTTAQGIRYLGPARAMGRTHRLSRTW